MLWVKNILSSFLVFLTLLIVFSLTYNNPQNIKWFTFDEWNGIFKITNEDWLLSLEKQSESHELNKLYKENITYLDQVYFLEKNQAKYSSQVKGSEIEINLWEGLYYFNLNDFRYEYLIKHKSFSVSPESLWRFFIDTRNYPEVTFFSIDSVFNISLLNEDEFINSLLIYPHMRVVVNSNRYRVAKWVNIMRLNDLFNIWYVWGVLFTDNKELNSKMIDSIVSLEDEEFVAFITEVYSLLSPTLDKNINYDFLIDSNFLFFWIKYIQKYFNLFLNESKKVVYLKNIILDDVNNMIKKKSLTPQFKSNFLEDLSELRSISEEDYMDIINVLITYYDWLIKQNSIWHFDIIIYLSDVLSELNPEFINKISSKSYFYLSQLYDLLNKWLLSDNQFQSDFVTFLENFMVETWIVLSWDYDIIDFSKSEDIVLEFLSFFIRNIIINNTSFDNLDNISNFLFINNFYYSLNNSVKYSDQVRRSEMLIIEYSSVLDVILTEIRRVLFLEDRNSRGLLEVNRNNNIQRPILNELDSLMKNYFNFYNRNKENISQRNNLYINIYKDYTEKYREYYLALSNYDEYQNQYDEVRGSLFWVNTIVNSFWQWGFTKEDIMLYLWDFVWLDKSRWDFSIDVEDWFFRVNNISLLDKVISFNIYPDDFNLVSDFIIDWVNQNMSFELDTIKLDWDERYRWSPPEDRDKYDFRRFFANTFSSNIIDSNRNEFVIDNDNDDKIDRNIAVFIRDRLLNKRFWEFSPVLNSWTLDIKFENVSVEIQENSYNISLKDVDLKTRVDIANRVEQLSWVFNSDYVFSEEDHYFKNIWIYLYDMNRLQRWEKSFDFWWNKIEIGWNINILDFSYSISDILSSFYETRSVYNDIVDLFLVTDIDIKISSTWLISYKFYNWINNIEVVIFRGDISRINVEGDNIIDWRTLNIRQLKPFLERLK